jgi:diguanylate cyclase (GGDEF)-like protein
MRLPFSQQPNQPAPGTQREAWNVPVADVNSGNGPIMVTATAFMWLLAVASLDARLLDTRFSVLLFYLIPIAWAGWFAGQTPALIVAVFSACMRFGVEIVEEHNHGSSRPELLWSIGSELLFFLIFTALLVKLRGQLDLERSLARSDGLTRLYNARAFHDAVSSERERLRRYGRRLTLIYFDLDNFKFVNDKWGHGAGDEVLQTIADQLRANIRQVDVGARLGGDEFALLLPETDENGARVVLERLKTRIIEAMQARGWPVTASFGGVTFEDASIDVAEMLQVADAAMYHAKKSGKNQICLETFGENEDGD